MRSGAITSDVRQSFHLGIANTKFEWLELASHLGTQILLEHLIYL